MGQQNAIAAADPAPQNVVDNPDVRLQLAAMAYRAFREAEKKLAMIEEILGQGELVARMRGVSRADQFRAFTAKNESKKALESALGVKS